MNDKETLAMLTEVERDTLRADLARMQEERDALAELHNDEAQERMQAVRDLDAERALADELAAQLVAGTLHSRDAVLAKHAAARGKP